MFKFWIQDEGEGFNIKDIPFSPDNEDEFEVGGRGIKGTLGLLMYSESAIEELWKKIPISEWPTSVSEDRRGALSFFDEGRGLEIKIGWHKAIQDAAAAHAKS